MSPSVISTIRFAIRIAVVFPQPDGPTRTQISPASTSRRQAVDGGLVGSGIALRRAAERDRERPSRAVRCESPAPGRSYPSNRGSAKMSAWRAVPTETREARRHRSRQRLAADAARVAVIVAGAVAFVAGAAVGAGGGGDSAEPVAAAPVDRRAAARRRRHPAALPPRRVLRRTAEHRARGARHRHAGGGDEGAAPPGARLPGQPPGDARARADRRHRGGGSRRPTASTGSASRTR